METKETRKPRKKKEMTPDMLRMKELTPRKIVEELDKYIIGQLEAKRKVAIALRNRYRRSQLPPELIDEVIPKNILMIGPTGVGKTEIARRLSRLADAPFIKVEATKYTEVGYVGRDVESMVRDLMEIGIRMVQDEMIKKVEEKAMELAVDRILDAMKPKASKPVSANPFQMILGSLTGPASSQTEDDEDDEDEENEEENREKAEKERRITEAYKKERDFLRDRILKGEMDDNQVEIEVDENSNMNTINVFSQAGLEEMGVDFQSILGNFMPKKRIKRTLKVKDALKLLRMEEANSLIDREEVKSQAVQRVEQHGIIFIDEMDKVAGREKGHGPDVSREGVQRDILPIVEGSTVITKYGPVRTDHILFVAAGAFNVSKPSDLIPELQGRFPIRVEMKSLFKDEFVRILTEPKNALTKQYKALLAADGVDIEFEKTGISELAALAETVNANTENIGARRLHTILEKLLEELAFNAPEVDTEKITINEAYVRERLADIVENEDLSRFIL